MEQEREQDRRGLVFRMQCITPKSIYHQYEKANTHRLSERNRLKTTVLQHHMESAALFKLSYHQSESKRGNTEGKNNVSFPNNLIMKVSFFQVGKLMGDV